MFPATMEVLEPNGLMANDGVGNSEFAVHRPRASWEDSIWWKLEHSGSLLSWLEIHQEVISSSVTYLFHSIVSHYRSLVNQKKSKESSG